MNLGSELNNRRARLENELRVLRGDEKRACIGLVANAVRRSPMAGLLGDRVNRYALEIARELWADRFVSHYWDADQHGRTLESMRGTLQALEEWIAGTLEADDIDWVLETCIEALEAAKGRIAS
jgi:hypothetical protein